MRQLEPLSTVQVGINLAAQPPRSPSAWRNGLIIAERRFSPSAGTLMARTATVSTALSSVQQTRTGIQAHSCQCVWHSHVDKPLMYGPTGASI